MQYLNQRGINMYTYKIFGFNILWAESYKCINLIPTLYISAIPKYSVNIGIQFLCFDIWVEIYNNEDN